jgi:hypothetical protein
MEVFELAIPAWEILTSISPSRTSILPVLTTGTPAAVRSSGVWHKRIGSADSREDYDAIKGSAAKRKKRNSARAFRF